MGFNGMSAKIPPKPLKPNKLSKDTIYVDVDDEITGIIDKIENAKHDIVALVLPKRATMLQSIVNMRLLKRSADTAGKSVVLITSEVALLPLAGVAGLHAAKSLQSKPIIPPAPTSPAEKPDPSEEEPAVEEDDLDDIPTTLDHHRSTGELAKAPADDEENEETIVLDDAETEESKNKAASEKSTEAPKDKKIKVPNFDRFRMFLVLGILGAIGFVVFIILAIFVLPKATINIKATSLPVSANLSLITSDSAKQLDLAKKIIPVTLKTTDQKVTQQVQATGQQNNGTKASGTVTLANCTVSPVTIPAGTGVSTNGLTFITQNSLSLTDGNFTGGGVCKSTGSHVGSVSVISQGAGAKYNVAPSTFTVSGYSGVSGSSGSSMTGGTDNIITVVSQTDLDNAKAKITSGDADKFVKAFEDQLAQDGYYVLVATLKPSDPAVSSTPSVGQPASTATTNIKITYTVLAVKKMDLSSAVSDSLNKQMDKTKQKLSAEDVLQGASVTVQNQTTATEVTINISVNTTAVPILDIAGIKKGIVGKKSNDIKSTINALPGVKDVEVKMSPFWVSKVPANQSKITVNQQQVKD